MYDGDQVIDEHCISHTCNCSGRKAFGLGETVYWGYSGYTVGYRVLGM